MRPWSADTCSQPLCNDSVISVSWYLALHLRFLESWDAALYERNVKTKPMLRSLQLMLSTDYQMNGVKTLREFPVKHTLEHLQQMLYNVIRADRMALLCALCLAHCTRKSQETSSLQNKQMAAN